MSCCVVEDAVDDLNFESTTMNSKTLTYKIYGNTYRVKNEFIIKHMKV